MRVTIYVSNALRKDPRVQRSLRCAHENGIEVHFVGLQDGHYDRAFLDALPYSTTIVMIDQKYYGAETNVLIKILREVYRLFATLVAIVRTRPQVIHANDFDTVPVSWLAGKLTGAKVVYDSHEIYCENYGIARTRWRKKLAMAMERFFIHRVAQVVSVSNAASVKLAEMYRIPAPVVVTNCAYSVPMDVEARKHAGFEVLYHGRLTAGRGYEEFVAAARHVPAGVTLVLRGYGPLEKPLRQYVNEQGLQGKVVFAPPVEIDELIPAASESHVGVVLTKPVCVNFEFTVSNKLFEYLHAGIPVILSDLPEHRFLVEKHRFGLLVNSVTAEAIGEAITRLYEDRARYQELRANAMSAAKALCWEREGLKMIEIYRRIGGVQ